MQPLQSVTRNTPGPSIHPVQSQPNRLSLNEVTPRSAIGSLPDENDAGNRIFSDHSHESKANSVQGRQHVLVSAGPAEIGTACMHSYEYRTTLRHARIRLSYNSTDNSNGKSAVPHTKSGRGPKNQHRNASCSASPTTCQELCRLKHNTKHDARSTLKP